MKRFFDVPVYRLSREEYYRLRDAFVEKALFPNIPGVELSRARDAANPSENVRVRGILERSYGGMWEYNEIIGYIRLHFLGSQVRGEYFAVAKARIVRTRTKTLEFRSWKLVPEIEIPQPFTSAEILATVREYLRQCQLEVPRRHVDTEMFESIAPHVDWLALYRDT